MSQSITIEQSCDVRMVGEEILAGPVLAPAEAVLAHRYVTALSKRPIKFYAPDYNDGETKGFHYTSCWKALRDHLWDSWATLLLSLHRASKNALDVTEEELEEHKHYGDTVCLCGGNGQEPLYHYEMGIDLETGMPMLRCTVLGEQKIRD